MKGFPISPAAGGGQVFALGERLQKLLAAYPKAERFIRIDQPDCQGPMDTCELLIGSEIFLALYDDQELVHRLLNLSVETYCLFLERWFELIPPPADDLHSFFGMGHRGRICIRDDSAMNLSPEMYKEFILPYN